MANATISQIKVGNNTYDICDVAARDFTPIGEKIYPVGSIYLSIIATSPAILFGFGTWEALTAGYALWTSTTTSDYGNTAAATNTGSTTLTAAQSGLPAHSHTATDAGHTHNYEYAGDEAGNLSGSNPSDMGNVIRRRSPHEAIGLTTASGKASITVSNNTAKNATSGHTHTASTPARIYIHAWKRTA